MRSPSARFWRRFAVTWAATIALAVGAYLVARALARPATSHPWFAPRPGDHRPLVFAHQGGERLHPSNTLAGFRHAAALGADVLDTDVHLTKDGVLVLMHDTTVNRTTNGTGAVRDLTLAGIKQLDAGYRFTRDRGKTYPFRGDGMTVPTLEELFREFPDRRFGVEIKATSAEAGRKLADLIRRHRLEERVLVSSFHQPPMDALRAACPQVATSATADEVRTFLVLSWLRLVDAYTPRYHALQVPERRGSIQILTPRFLAHARRRNLPVVPWTINGAANLRRVIAMGVAGINTDEPDRLLELLR